MSGCLSLDTELKEVLAALNFLAVQLQQKDREYVRMQVEKYGIGSHLEQLQRKKNSTIYQKVEQILAFFS
ncbi:MAG: hypothetical protein JST59_02110 [Actinobacteria bacterium]|nr:hypothetical protein [Actinomycetota bacterium]